MRERCYDPAHNRFAHYGARGIRVCDRWLGDEGFDRFVADMGERPEGTSLDRVDVNGSYEPGNCRWATVTEQARNKRSNKFEPHEPAQIRWLVSQGYGYAEIARFFEVTRHSIRLIATGQIWKETP